MMDKEKILYILKDSDCSSEQKIKALLFAIFNIDDWRWIQNLCLDMAKNPDDDIAELSLTGLGHIARIHGKLDVDIVVPFLEEISINNNALLGRASDALDDIEIFIEDN